MREAVASSPTQGGAQRHVAGFRARHTSMEGRITRSTSHFHELFSTAGAQAPVEHRHWLARLPDHIAA